MTGQLYLGPKTKSLKRDKEGHREYKIVWQIKTTSDSDGPTVVMNTPGLPTVGSFWFFGNDIDTWAFCYPNLTITPVVKGERTDHWLVEQKFSTKPLNRCQDETIEDPLLEPQKVSGSFLRSTVEATEDWHGNKILSSSLEPIRGPQVEFDKHLPTVVIEQNVASLGLESFSSMIDKVNSAPLWGMAARKVKLGGVSWSRKLFGLCNFYFTRSFEFQVNDDTFDRDDILDEGTKARGGWNDDRTEWVPAGAFGNEADLNRYTDKAGNVAHVLLDGTGLPLGDAAVPVEIPLGTVKYYSEANFLLLGIPTNLESV